MKIGTLFSGGKLVMFQEEVENDHFGNPLTVFWSEDGAEWEFSTDWGAKDECLICGENSHSAPGFFWREGIRGGIVCENCVEVDDDPANMPPKVPDNQQ